VDSVEELGEECALDLTPAERGQDYSRRRSGVLRADETALRSEEFCKRFFELLYADFRVKKNGELRKVIVALENGAQTVAEFVQETGLKTARVYELRRQLKAVAEPVLNKMNREGDSYEQALPKRGAAIA
jgi:hypothetical protein